jgi:hypothetical protein
MSAERNALTCAAAPALLFGEQRTASGIAGTELLAGARTAAGVDGTADEWAEASSESGSGSDDDWINMGSDAESGADGSEAAAAAVAGDDDSDAYSTVSDDESAGAGDGWETASSDGAGPGSDDSDDDGAEASDAGSDEESGSASEAAAAAQAAGAAAPVPRGTLEEQVRAAEERAAREIVGRVEAQRILTPKDFEARPVRPHKRQTDRVVGGSCCGSCASAVRPRRSCGAASALPPARPPWTSAWSLPPVSCAVR